MVNSSGKFAVSFSGEGDIKEWDGIFLFFFPCELDPFMYLIKAIVEKDCWVPS